MQETREALLRAGESLFAEQGLDGPSLDAICARAGYTRGAFYVHFEDRDAFLAAVMERVGMPFLDAVLGATGDESMSVDVAMSRFVTALASGEYPLVREGAVRPSQLIDACTRSPRVRDRYAALIEDAIGRLAAILARGQAAGSVRADLSPRDAAVLFLAAIVGAQTMLVDLRLPLDVAAAAAGALKMLEARKGA
jgi:AcrR family transcriptional regulator